MYIDEITAREDSRLARQSDGRVESSSIDGTMAGPRSRPALPLALNEAVSFATATRVAISAREPSRLSAT